MTAMRHGIKILGLALVAALSLMAVTAVAAQAETENNVFLVGGSQLAEGTMESVAGTGAVGKLKTPNGMEVECEGSAAETVALPEGTFIENIKDEGGKLRGHGKIKVLYHGCKVVGDKFCTIYPTQKDLEKETNKGHITATALFLLLLRSKIHFLWLLGLPIKNGKGEVVEEEFTSVFYGGVLCTLPSPTKITGHTAAALPTALTQSVNQTIEAVTPAEEKAIVEADKLMTVTLIYGKETATLSGGAMKDAHLTGGNLGKMWGVG
jgi:hypothetical protein